jgi:hypothetical protein
VTLTQLAAGDKPTAQQLNDFGPLFVTKLIDETVTSSTTLQDDDELFLSVAANCTYWMDVLFLYRAAATPLIKIAFSGPTAATLAWTPWALHNSVTAATAGTIETVIRDISGEISLGVAGTGTTVTARPVGILTTSSTAGTFRVRWAQNVSNATGSVVKAGSSLMLRRVS